MAQMVGPDTGPDENEAPNGIDKPPGIDGDLWSRRLYAYTVGGAVSNSMQQSADLMNDPVFHGMGSNGESIGDPINLPGKDY